ncbi:unnamed protein product [Adineta steineri]|uniref:G-protein coupled receptors family 1 profile domain-containing protein n=1 Tax=Adineta steineri TaxID=433720 RepID=A0A814LJU6_9BILA|nr:unnamed protein product [Adineta steineri]
MDTLDEGTIILYRVKFFILLILQTLSILITLVVFTFFVTHRALLNTPQNQSIIFLLIVNFLFATVDLPSLTHFYSIGRVIPATAAYCTWWTFFEYTLNLINELLMTTISIQRHMLIFYAQILQIRFKRIVFYYLPFLFCLIYPIVFYLSIIVLYPCDGTQWDFTSKVCGYANCYLIYSKVLSTYDLAVNNGLPVVIILLANATLIIRVVRQKRRRQRVITWKKQRRMTLQLFSISTLYLIAWLPCLFIGLVQQLSSPSFLADFQFNYALDLVYVIYLLLPWLCLGLLPEFRQWIWKKIHRWTTVRNNDVRPV